MKVRISLIVVILAGGLVCGLNLVNIKQKIAALQSDLKQQNLARQKAEADLAINQKTLSTTTAALKQTSTALQAAKARREEALAATVSQTKRAEKFKEELTEIRVQRDRAQEKLAAYRGITPEQAATAAKMITSLEKNLATVQQENKILDLRLNALATDIYDGCAKYLPADLRGKVLAFDPKWHFVVLDVGEDQGVFERGELLASRNGKLVSKLRVTTVEKNYCVANIVPGWQLGDVLEGDLVIPAHRRS